VHQEKLANLKNCLEIRVFVLFPLCLMKSCVKDVVWSKSLPHQFGQFFLVHCWPEGILLFIALETFDMESSCMPYSVSSWIISANDIDREFSFNTSISSKSSSCNFEYLLSPLRLASICGISVFGDTPNYSEYCTYVREMYPVMWSRLILLKFCRL
jgi:hypothetical protein